MTFSKKMSPYIPITEVRGFTAFLVKQAIEKGLIKSNSIIVDAAHSSGKKRQRKY